MALENLFRVAIFDEFLDAFARIPKAQQKKVGRFLRKFREDPTSVSINYESIASFADPNLRTARIDQAYRAIVLRPEEGNVYVLLWVDHHDEAMRWAENKTITVHPETGAIQVVSAAPALPPPPPATDSGAGPLFDRLRDRELLRLGVPQPYLERVREVAGLDDLERLQDALPSEAFEALYWLAEGESLDEVERAMAVSPPAAVDPGDFAAALERDVSRRRFALVEDDAQLEAMLDAPLDKWRIFLHPSQRVLVERDWNGPVRVLGGAGTGKTVVAMHRAAYLAEEVYAKPNERILFTTFTRNLAADVRDNLSRLASPEAMARIDVVHIDGWVSDLLRSAGYRYDIRYWGRGHGRDGDLEDLWEKALALDSGSGLSRSFFRDEWELVVQAQGCESWDDYKAASRSGRGVRLSRGQRKAIWPVFDEYRLQLERRGLREPEDAMRDATALLERGTARVNLRSIVVDEAQDMSTNAFRMLRAALGEERANDLFIVGDGHQRIYRRRVVLSRAGVNVRGRGRRLRINYRTTDEIRRFAVAVLEGVEFDDLDAGVDAQRGYRSLTHGVEPEVRELPGFDAEVDAILSWLAPRSAADAGGEAGARQPTTCLAARTNLLRDRYADALEARGTPVLRLTGKKADDPCALGVRVATLHRVKGLEFDRMILAGMSDDQMPLRVAVDRSEDAAVRREAELMERALLYVALTRAREAVLITAPGRISRWVH